MSLPLLQMVITSEMAPIVEGPFLAPVNGAEFQLPFMGPFWPPIKS